jgi:replication factor C small subunit
MTGKQYKVCKIKSIRKIDSEVTVYDITVKKNHNFIMSNGILSHNSVAAQGALRNIMEQFHENSRFILTANYIQKIIEPIKSRCMNFEFKGASKKDIIKRLAFILKNEKVKFDLQNLVKIVTKFYPDIRSMVNALQQLSVEGDLKPLAILDTKSNTIIELLKKKDIDGIRKLLSKENIILEDMYSFIFNNAEKISEKAKLDIMLAVSEYMYRDCLIVDKVMNFVALCIEITRSI